MAATAGHTEMTSYVSSPRSSLPYANTHANFAISSGEHPQLSTGLSGFDPKKEPPRRAANHESSSAFHYATMTGSASLV